LLKSYKVVPKTMKSKERIELDRKFPSPIFHYFHIANLEEQYHEFMAHGGLPRFRYGGSLDLKLLNNRKQRILESTELIVHNDALAFARRRLIETELLLLVASRSKNDTTYHAKYRDHISALYSLPDKVTLAESLKYVLRRSAETNTQNLASKVAEVFSISPSQNELFAPGNRLFNENRALFLRIAKELKIGGTTDVNSLIEESLNHIGANEHGWVVKPMKHGRNLAVSTPRRQVLVGRYFNPKSDLRLKQVIAHEVYGHVLRAIKALDKPKYLPLEEEGIAIMCEQLVAPVYTHKRVIRFILVCAAWGLDGITNRTFCDVYDIAWRLNCIIKGDKEEDARVDAFYECARVFRGGSVEGGGSIMPKDAQYLVSNNRLWRLIQENPSINIQKLLMI
jgi:hypothetical protein